MSWKINLSIKSNIISNVRFFELHSFKGVKVRQVGDLLPTCEGGLGRHVVLLPAAARPGPGYGVPREGGHDLGGSFKERKMDISSWFIVHIRTQES